VDKASFRRYYPPLVLVRACRGLDRGGTESWRVGAATFGRDALTRNIGIDKWVHGKYPSGETTNPLPRSSVARNALDSIASAAAEDHRVQSDMEQCPFPRLMPPSRITARSLARSASGSIFGSLSGARAGGRQLRFRFTNDRDQCFPADQDLRRPGTTLRSSAIGKPQSPDSGGDGRGMNTVVSQALSAFSPACKGYPFTSQSPSISPDVHRQGAEAAPLAW
jgi:hypothetical protein